ncbi:MAG: type VI secretion system baseplate subunit TssG, partial [Gammaproteobacteria bacterium]|nr:type VI secretion system baseplate subunit TssG [Gammaproteobacteria bacterium]
MDTKKRTESSSVAEKLFTEAHAFEFFQATRLLQGLVHHVEGSMAGTPVGYDTAADKENLRFTVPATLKFQASEISSIKPLQNEKGANTGKLEMQV